MADDPNAAAAAATPPAWYAGFQSQDLRGLVETKKWAGPEEAIASYSHLEKLAGAPPERLVRLPEKADDPAWADVRAKVGMAPPAKPEDYGIAAPDGADPAFLALIQTEMHKQGLTKGQAQGVAATYMAEVEKYQAATAQAALQQSEAEMTQLRTDWGGQYDSSIALARRAVHEFSAEGADMDTLNAMEERIGTAKFVKLWAAIGSKMGEAKFTDGGDAGAGNFGMTPDMAQRKIGQLILDQDFQVRWNRGDVAAVNEWTRLNLIAGRGKAA